jgi:hypothetical protein
VAWSGGAGSDEHGQPRIAVTDGSRESQPSGLELLPDLPPREFVLGGLTIAPQLAVGDGAPGLLAGLATRWALLVLFQRPMTTVLPKPWSDEEELLARWADERLVGDLSRPAGPGWGNHRPVGPIRWPARWAYPLVGGVWRGLGG